MRSIVINGTSITVSGSGSVEIINGRVIVGGKDLTPGAKDIRIEIHGDVLHLEGRCCTDAAVGDSYPNPARLMPLQLKCGRNSGVQHPACG